ncbi:MAG TPA: lactonase family protein [Bacillales bacterium]|nr:lactonase family protein [Bacillales bacterium]
MNHLKNNEIFIYVGSYTNKEAEGLSIAAFDPKSGAASLVGRLDGIAHPSFLTIDSKRGYLYAVSETVEAEGRQSGKVVSYKINPETGELIFRSEQLTGGAAPCYVSLSSEGDRLFVANYTGGNVCVFPLEEGRIGEMADEAQHEGSSCVRPDRQEAPHPHSIILDPSGRFAYVQDLGQDKIVIYRLGEDRRKLIYHKDIRAEPGAGPRHLIFHHTEPFAYVINELDSTISSFFCRDEGSLESIQTISTLPESYSGENTAADLHISPCGHFLYASNRGHDSIGVYKIDLETGALAYVDHTSTRGKNPRNFALSPDGEFLIAANQDSDSIVTFSIDRDTGELSDPVDSMTVSEPVCVKFLY